MTADHMMGHEEPAGPFDRRTKRRESGVRLQLQKGMRTAAAWLARLARERVRLR